MMLQEFEIDLPGARQLLFVDFPHGEKIDSPISLNSGQISLAMPVSDADFIILQHLVDKDSELLDQARLAIAGDH